MQKKHSQDRQTKPTFNPPNIFVTEEHIKPPQPVERIKDYSGVAETTEQVAIETNDQTVEPTES